MDKDLIEAAQAQVEIMKELFKYCDDEFYQLQAQHVKKMHDAYVAAGFSTGTAIDFIKATLTKSN